MKNPNILKRRQVLGIPFFTHKRLEERDHVLPVPDGALSYPGILVLGKFWDGLAKDQEIPRKQDWVQLLVDALSYSLLSLVWKGQVKVRAHKDRRVMLFGLLRTNTSNFSLHQGEAFSGGDLLGKRLFKLVGALEKLPRDKNNVDKLGNLLFTSFFGGGLMDEPARRLFEEVMLMYSKGYPWLQVELKRTALLRGKVVQYQIGKGNGPLLAEEYHRMRGWMETWQENDVDYIQLMRALSNSISMESSMRISTASTTP